MQNSELSKACAFTGHRPERFGFGYDEADDKCVKLKAAMREQIEALITEGVTEYHTGMALGVDQWAAEIVLDLKRAHSGLRLIAVRPCETQADSWTVEQRERHFDTLALCDEVVTVQPRYSRGVMFQRNRRLVDYAGHLLAVYDGDAKGGTAYTVKYGKQKGRRIIVVHPDTLVVTQL